MSRVTEKMTYTDGRYFCNVCDSPHEGESLAEACFDECNKEDPDPSVFECEHCGETFDLAKQSAIEFVCQECEAITIHDKEVS